MNISTEAELRSFLANPEADVTLMSDIILTSPLEIAPAYSGVFSGNGYTIYKAFNQSKGLLEEDDDINEKE